MTEPAEMSPADPGRAAGPAASEADEFAHIPRPRGRHPIIALGGALLAFFLVFHERHDLRYALMGTTPLDLGRASGLNQRAAEGLENRYVRVTGTPDRESALEIDTKGSWVFTQLFRMLGTGDHLFVHRPPSPLPAALAESDTFEGRLIRVNDLSFADAIRKYFATYVSATHFFAPDAFARAVGARARPTAPLTVPDLSGDPVALAAGTQVAVDVAEPDQVRVGLPRARFATEADARAGHHVARRRRSSRRWARSRRVRRPTRPRRGRCRRRRSRPRAGRSSRASRRRCARVRWTRSATWITRSTSATRASRCSCASRRSRPRAGGGLVLRPGQGPAREVPADAVAAVHTLEPVVVPADAYLLVEGDRPRQHLPAVLIAAHSGHVRGGEPGGSRSRIAAVSLRIYDTRVGKKVPFVPLKEGKVGMYSCGVTVYDRCHVGHARMMVAFDVIVRHLRASGYDVTFVRNVTDVDDKIIKRGEIEGRDRRRGRRALHAPHARGPARRWT